MTYLGGSGYDSVQTVAADASGNLIVAGVSSSPNFPGASLGDSPTFLFITKLDPTLSKVIFTTVLGASPNISQNVHFADDNSLTTDNAGNIYLAGYSASVNFPTTPGAWRRSGSGGVAVKLDPSGNIAYSTYIGTTAWSAEPLRIRVRNGIAYLAGQLTDPGFRGTPGALQPALNGGSDIFVCALTQDGSGVVFATAVGGSGDEALSDMTLDAAGNIVITGTSSSPDLPLTADAFPYSNQTAQAEGILIRINSAGTQLLTSTWLGTSQSGALTLCPDGSVAFAGSSQSSRRADALGASFVAVFSGQRQTRIPFESSP